MLKDIIAKIRRLLPPEQAVAFDAEVAEANFDPKDVGAVLSSATALGAAWQIVKEGVAGIVTGTLQDPMRMERINAAAAIITGVVAGSRQQREEKVERHDDVKLSSKPRDKGNTSEVDLAIIEAALKMGILTEEEYQEAKRILTSNKNIDDKVDDLFDFLDQLSSSYELRSDDGCVRNLAQYLVNVLAPCIREEMKGQSGACFNPDIVYTDEDVAYASGLTAMRAELRELSHQSLAGRNIQEVTRSEDGGYIIGQRLCKQEAVGTSRQAVCGMEASAAEFNHQLPDMAARDAGRATRG